MAPSTNASDVMMIGRNLSPRPFEGRLKQRSAALVCELRELDDQDGVLRGKTDQHHKSNLRVDIVLHAGGLQARRTPRNTANGIQRMTANGTPQLS